MVARTIHIARGLLLRAMLSASLIGWAVASAQAAPALATVTILDGSDAALLRGNSRYALAEGVRLQGEDIVETGSEMRLLRLEFSDGLGLSLGPASQAMLAPRLVGDRAARIYLLSGWAKLNATADKPAASAVVSPVFDALALVGDTVIRVGNDNGEIFAESGSAQVRAAAGKQALSSGQSARIGKDGQVASPSARPSSEFIQQLPRSFMDTLPPRLGLFQSRDVAPKRLADLSYADLRPWLNGEPALRRASLAHWKHLATQPDFRKALIGEIRLHPEWEALLLPPKIAPSSVVIPIR